MLVLHTDHVDFGLQQCLKALATDQATRRGSRNGEVVAYNSPVVTVFQHPKHRVSFWAGRDANPFFHLAEACWMLGGRNDVDFVAQYVQRMASFSDDSEILHGAYGHRWRRHFGFDQLVKIAHRLREDPDDRRCVLQMWDANEDLDVPSKDLPCNTHAYFSRSPLGALDMTVMSRSHDAIWGAFGANAVHFSILMEYIASSIGCPVGVYTHFSNNMHAYTPLYNQLLVKLPSTPLPGYSELRWKPFPLMSVPQPKWDEELAHFLNGEPCTYREPFFQVVAQPMHDAYRYYKDGHLERAIEILPGAPVHDWHVAGQNWLMRRLMRRLDNLDRTRSDSPAEET